MQKKLREVKIRTSVFRYLTFLRIFVSGYPPLTPSKEKKDTSAQSSHPGLSALLSICMFFFLALLYFLVRVIE